MDNSWWGPIGEPLCAWLPECGTHRSHFVNGRPKYDSHPAFALWVGDSRTYLCKEALDHWLDNADDDPSLEPKELVFL